MIRYRLKRLLNRDISFRAIEKSDLKYLWAAYKKNAFSDDILPRDLDQNEFTMRVTDILNHMNEVFMLESVTVRGKIPIGMISTMATSRMEPRTDWFPWASNRNKIEATAYFLTKMRKRPMLIWANDDTLRFFTRIAQYGALRRVGKVTKFLDGKDMMLFQTRSN